MIESIVFGSGFAFAAAIQPGPLQAFLLARVAAAGWKRTLPAVLAPLLSDIPIAALVLLVLGRLPGAAQQGLRAAGGVLLVYLAWAAFRQLRFPPEAPAASAPSAPRTFFQAVLVNVLNPNPYLGWALVLGPASVAAWHHDPASAVALVVAFYGTIVATLAAFVVLFGTARFLSERARRGLIAVAAAALAVLGAYQLAVSVPRLLTL
ncbi:MAG TPA: LysE family transporter [Thermoanaerobaculaceae bacterium]|nr:LysE family transporter [Thermoanaerobaculaceae bacterium]HQU34685.1 LysE family transporter [Thermoanaerobaculaceae bacterium]